MEQVVAVVIGALLAIIGSVVLQLLVVLAAETRRRRKERWEASLAALGERLLFNEQAAAEAVREAQHDV